MSAQVLSWKTRREAETALAACDSSQGFPRQHQKNEYVTRASRKTRRAMRAARTETMSKVVRSPEGDRWGFVVPPEQAELTEAIPPELYTAAEWVQVEDAWVGPGDATFDVRRRAR
jgi:hypothetical protein